MLTFEYDSDGERVYIHCDNAGINNLVSFLQQLKDLKAPADIQLMSNEWGGEELDSDEKNVEGKLIHLVKIMKWDC